MPLPIGFGQTNSQPSTVRFMLERLEVQPGDKVMDVGSGSGWTSALLAQLVGDKGRVYAVEKIEELVKFGRENCQALDIKNVSFFQASSRFGLPGLAPFDRILVSASASELPQELCDQMKTGGKMVIPIGGSLLEIEKLESGEFSTYEHKGFAFVPLT
jgi:protein-L-isoaspartate(D-aspartate) O-methyltransferase